MALPFGTILGGLYGQEMSADDRRKAMQELETILGEYQGIKPPTQEDLSYAPEDIPFLMKAFSERPEALGASAYDEISLDPDLRNAQMEALSSLQQLGQGEMTAMDMARLNDIQRKTSQAERGSREAILSNMQRRGMGGSGMELAAQLQNQQSAADRASQQALGVEALAQQRALEAMQQRGTMAGRMESEDFRREQQRAEAADAIQKFNAMQRAGAQQRNIQGMRDLQASRQGTAATNVAARNVAAAGRADAAGEAYRAQLAKAAGVGGARKDIGAERSKRAEDIQRMYSGMGASVDQSQKEDEDRFANVFGGFLGGGM